MYKNNKYEAIWLIIKFLYWLRTWLMIWQIFFRKVMIWINYYLPYSYLF